MIEKYVWRVAAQFLSAHFFLFFATLAILWIGSANSSNASSLQNRPAVEFLSEQSRFVLDATRMTPGGTPVGFQWTLTARPVGSTASITNGTSPVATLSADGVGPYTVELILTEAGTVRAPVVMHLAQGGLEPVAAIKAEGGAAPVTQGSLVTLSGASSYDPDGGRLQYQWALTSKPAGSAAAFNGQDDAVSSFVPDVTGAYTVSLTVTDPTGTFAVDSLTLTTGAGLTVANAGIDQRAEVGETVFVDAFESLQTEGKPLTSDWKILYVPAGSLATLVDGAFIEPKATGRQSLTLDLAGTYLLGANVSGGGSVDTDTAVISIGSDANVAPLAVAGPGKLVAVGEQVLLDATKSTDIDGDALKYRWSLVSAPQSSLASLANPSLPYASVTPDIPGTYVVQLSVYDGKSVSHTTTTLFTQMMMPLADAGPDKMLTDAGTANVGVNASVPPAAYSWAVTGLGTPNAALAASFSAPASAATQVSFTESFQAANPAASLGQHELIVFENANIRSQVYGRSFIGGNLQGLTSDYGSGLAFNSAPSNVILRVGGQINGQTLTINNGGSVAAKGSVNAGINLNGGGRIVADAGISVAALRQELETFSTSLAAMPVTGVIPIPIGQPAPVAINAIPNARGIAVFSVDGNALFDNAKVQQISVDPGSADALVINVAGKNVKLRYANFDSGSLTASIYSKVIWNFKDAVNVQIDRTLAGTILAPKAQVLINSEVRGGVVSRSINQKAAIVTPGFVAIAPFAPASSRIDAAVVQVKATAGDSIPSIPHW